MRIKGMIPSFVPTVPERLKNKFEFRATFDLTEVEAKLFSYALIKLDEQLIEENVDLDLVPKAFVIFTEDGKFEVSSEEGILGSNTHLLFYAVKRMRDYNLNEGQKVSIFLEEFCHYLWNIEDEVKVKYKIFDILKRIYPKSKIEDFFKAESLR